MEHIHDVVHSRFFRDAFEIPTATHRSSARTAGKPESQPPPPPPPQRSLHPISLNSWNLEILRATYGDSVRLQSFSIKNWAISRMSGTDSNGQLPGTGKTSTNWKCSDRWLTSETSRRGSELLSSISSSLLWYYNNQEENRNFKQPKPFKQTLSNRKKYTYNIKGGRQTKQTNEQRKHRLVLLGSVCFYVHLLVACSFNRNSTARLNFDSF